jgi:tetratricopeptide (TPR) repeat protein
MRFQLSGAIERLVETHRRKGNLNQALIYAQHWVHIEPYDDEANRLLIQLYADAGQRDFAIRHYNKYTGLLKHDLNIMPDESVTSIFQLIKSGARRSHPYNRASFTGLLFHVNFSSLRSSLSSTDEFYLEKLNGYVRELSKIIKNFGGKVFSSQLKSISALFFEGEPLSCALAIEDAHHMEYPEFSTVRSPGIVIHEIIDSNLLDLLDSPEYRRVDLMSQSAWEGQIIITPRVLANFDLPEGSQIIDFGYHTFEGIHEPIHMLGLIHPKF